MKNKEILDQLILKNLDENLKIPDIIKSPEMELKTIDKSSPSSSSKDSLFLTSTKIMYSKTGKDTILIEKEPDNNKLKSNVIQLKASPLITTNQDSAGRVYTTTIQDLVGSLRISKNPNNSNEIIIKTGKTKNQEETSNVDGKKYLVWDEKKTNKDQSAQILQEPELQLLNYNEDRTTVDPLETVAPNDELANVDVSDNADPLKTPTAQIFDDSDGLKTDDGAGNSSFDSDNQNVGDDNKITSNSLLTLEDIKDSGLDGKDLFKCCQDNCSYAADNPNDLKSHLNNCIFRGNEKTFVCVHCSKRFLKIGLLVDHLKIHGLKRFGCALCDHRFPMPQHAINHMKSKHKVMENKVIPADPKNPSADGLFIVQPVSSQVSFYSLFSSLIFFYCKCIEKEYYS